MNTKIKIKKEKDITLNNTSEPSIKKETDTNEIKQEDKSTKKRSLDESSSESPFKIFKVSEHIGECPTNMVLMLFDVKKNKPFMISLNIASSSYHIFKIMEWSKDKNIKFDYITEDIHRYVRI